MSKFSDILTLRRAVVERNDEGVAKKVMEDTDVFFNRYRVSLSNRIAGASEGLFSVASGQVRSADYDGQELAVLDGVEHTVEDANNQGEFTVLTLKRRLGNG